MKIRSIYWKHKLGSCGRNIRIGKNLTINYPKGLHIGNNVSLNNNISFTISRNCKSGGVIIEDGVSINKWCDFGCDNKIIIEENVLFGPFVHVSDRDHIFEDIQTPIKKQGSFSKGPVIIGAGTWLGFRSQIMSNVKIGKNCVIAAGAIVTKDIPDYCVVAGNPARIVRKYNTETQKWEKVSK